MNPWIYGGYLYLTRFNGIPTSTSYDHHLPSGQAMTTRNEEDPALPLHPIVWCPFLEFLVWLVLLTILKNISQWEGLSHIL